MTFPICCIKRKFNWYSFPSSHRTHIIDRLSWTLSTLADKTLHIITHTRQQRGERSLLIWQLLYNHLSVYYKSPLKPFFHWSLLSPPGDEGSAPSRRPVAIILTAALYTCDIARRWQLIANRLPLFNCSVSPWRGVLPTSPRTKERQLFEMEPQDWWPFNIAAWGLTSACCFFVCFPPEFHLLWSEVLSAGCGPQV